MEKGSPASADHSQGSPAWDSDFNHKALICLFIYVLILGPSLPDTDLCGKQQRNDSEILPR